MIGDRGSDNDIALVVKGRRERQVVIAKLAYMVGSRPALHRSNLDRIAGTDWHDAIAHQTEITDAIKLIIVRYTAGAIAEPDLRT